MQYSLRENWETPEHGVYLNDVSSESLSALGLAEMDGDDGMLYIGKQIGRMNDALML